MRSETESSPESTMTSEDYTTPSEFTDEIDTINTEQTHQQDVIINQYVKNVLDFSSQYGSNFSISYTAYNITGRPSKYPDYGDFPETFAMRTYGKWWDTAPSGAPEIMPQTLPEIVSQDYIVLEFEEFVFPHQVSIFETYNPGALVKIWAFTLTEKWICLWEDKPMKAPKKARLFSPPIKTIQIPTRIIRLDFNHSCLDYFTEIDAVMMIGRKYNSLKIPEFLSMNRHKTRKGPIIRKLESVCFKPVIVQNHQEFLKEFLVNDFESFVIEAGLKTASGDFNDVDYQHGIMAPLTMKHLPSEILFNIFKYLDLESLFRASQTCKKFHAVAIDPLLYKEVNLQPYWNLVDSMFMQTLSRRCKLITKLDMSWCGLYNTLTAADFNGFIKLCGKHLTHLRLNTVKFLDASSLDVIGTHCRHLKELSLRNCSTTNIFTHSSIANFKNLERLDLFKATIDFEILFIMLRNNPKLKHLNLGFFRSTNMDNVAIQISQTNLEIVSIDMWKSQVLSSLGLIALAKCTQLEEVDFGWCLREEASPGESLKSLVKGCPKLKKIFLASIRGLTDRDLENIANYCKNIEQLDLMGVMGISTDKCLEILKKCTKLKLLDLSFCDQLDDEQVALWKDHFNVSIKQSPVPSDSYS